MSSKTRSGSLAQLVEQLTFNQLVAGSNPARPTILAMRNRYSACKDNIAWRWPARVRHPPRHSARSPRFPYDERHSARGRTSRSGSLAQLVEQLTFNQLVAGSNPARPTIIPDAYRCIPSRRRPVSCSVHSSVEWQLNSIIVSSGSLAQLVEQLTFNQLVAGSNPARPTILAMRNRYSACKDNIAWRWPARVRHPPRHSARSPRFPYDERHSARGRTSRRGSLAQLVEQLTFNQLVAGSNPARPTILRDKKSMFSVTDNLA